MRRHHRLGTAMRHAQYPATLEDIETASPAALAEWYLTVLYVKRQLEVKMQERGSGFAHDVPVGCALGSVTQRYGRERKEWQTEGLVQAVCKAIQDRRRPAYVDPETGEAGFSWDQGVAAIREVWNLPAPRTTALRPLGIDPDEYCTSGGRSVSYRVIDHRNPLLGDTGDD